MEMRQKYIFYMKNVGLLDSATSIALDVECKQIITLFIDYK